MRDERDRTLVTSVSSGRNHWVRPISFAKEAAWGGSSGFNPEEQTLGMLLASILEYLDALSEYFRSESLEIYYGKGKRLDRLVLESSREIQPVIPATRKAPTEIDRLGHNSHWRVSTAKWFTRDSLP